MEMDYRVSDLSVVFYIGKHNLEIQLVDTLGIYPGPGIHIIQAIFDHIKLDDSEDVIDAHFYVKFTVNDELYEAEGTWWKGELRSICETLLEW